MKTTRCFEEQVLRKCLYLKRAWCEKALEEPAYYDTQPEDDRMRYYSETDSLYIQ